MNGNSNSTGSLRHSISPHPCIPRSGKLFLACCLLGLCLGGPNTDASEDLPAEEQGLKVYEIEAMEVRAEKPATVSSDQLIRDKDFLNFPNQTPSDLLRIMPGIFINQHTGGGKAHQIFLRGFDAEHGQDLAGFLDGIPLNETSQVHGQGYLDLHFLVPETLQRIRVIKGPYLPEYGNFAVAGAMDFLTRPSLPENRLSVGYGSFNTFRGLGQVGANLGGREIYFTAEGDRGDGFTNPGEWWGVRGLFSALIPVGTGRDFRVLTSHYQSDFDSADVVPTNYSYVQRDAVGRFDSVDDSGGGESIRHLLGLSYDWHRRERTLNLSGYYNYRKTVLFTNYTYFLLNPDPSEGDQYELWEQRHYGGVRSSYSLPSPLFGLDLQTKVGLDARVDQVDQMQWNTHTRERFNKITDYDFLESNLGGYVKETLFLNKYLQVMAGLRLDAVLYDVDGTQDVDFKNLCENRPDTLQDVPVAVDTYQWTTSPKTSVVITPFDRPARFFNSLDLFLNYGEGFYTTRAPLIANQEAPDVSGYPNASCVELPTRYPGIQHDIPKARGAEGAFRLHFWERKASVAGTIWWADKEEELVFEPETGISIPRGSSRRIGQEAELRVEPLDWLYVTLDIFRSDAEFKDEQAGMSSDAIPGTPEFILQHVVSVRHPKGVHGSLRGRYVGERPLPREKPLSTLHSDPYYVMDLLAGYEKSRWAVVVAIENLFDTEWDDTSYAYPSSPEPSATRPAGTGTYQGKYITPGTPFAIRGEVTLKF
jgi:hypothetical protein